MFFSKETRCDPRNADGAPSPERMPGVTRHSPVWFRAEPDHPRAGDLRQGWLFQQRHRAEDRFQAGKKRILGWTCAASNFPDRAISAEIPDGKAPERRMGWHCSQGPVIQCR